MELSNKNLRLSVFDEIGEIDSAQWNSIAVSGKYSPFLEYEFLSSLETSGCISPDTGWYPRHFVLHNGNQLIGIAPAYIKTHSMGEFIFDQGLAQVAMKMNKTYYPKLVATLPFTPSPGYRFLIDSTFNEMLVAQTLQDGMMFYRDKSNLASHSLLFVDPNWEFFHGDNGSNTCPHSSDEQSSFQSWVHHYFLWENKEYANFEDFLCQFNKNQRRNIQRERSSIKEEGIVIRSLTGAELSKPIMDNMFKFYKSTNEQFGPWAAFYLNREWFHEIARIWGHRIRIFAASRANRDEIIAMSMIVQKEDSFFGRYWGASEYVRNLHFELCFYTPIEYAIEHGIANFDPGMGSAHKTRRGFGSHGFKSYHAFIDPDIARLFSEVLPVANNEEWELIRKLDNMIPWRNPK